jgi:L,D-peptidoglycan transpeptidase YkuD (ErfK/YbiS/YcfS/YnhG family)
MCCTHRSAQSLCRGWLMLAFWLYTGFAWAADHPAASPLSASRQLVLVTAPEWNSTAATLRRFERTGGAASWHEIAAPIRVSLGRSGLGWGRGRHADIRRQGPVKREGDGRAPAGIFALSALFGYATRHSLAARTVKLPYWPATPDLQCVDDPSSSEYNRIVHSSRHRPIDWQSHEAMLRDDNQYAWGVVVAHNTSPAMPQAGSCIFLHVWKGENEPTEGCTAGAATDIAQLVLWLKAESAPMLVQLPESEYRRLKPVWNLP